METATWLGGISDKLHAKLVKQGLTTARRAPITETPDSEDANVLLGSFLTDYIAKKTDVKRGTKWVYQHTQRNLIEFFGADRSLESITSADAARRFNVIALQHRPLVADLAGDERRSGQW